MGRDCPAEGDIEKIRKAADKALTGIVFERSPVLSRLLSYLVEMTATGSAIKSYTIAIDGLGKSHADTSEADTYARVAVARLRKALSVHYRDAPGDDELYIDSGTYEVRIKSRVERPPAVNGMLGQEGLRRRWPIGKATIKALIASAAFAALLLAIFAIYKAERRQQMIWSSLNLPTLTVEAAKANGESNHTQEEIETHRQSLMMALSGYAGSRVNDVDSLNPDYRVKIHLSAEGAASTETISLVENKSGRLVWSDDYAIGSEQGIQRASELAAFAISSPSGALHSFARRPGYDVQSPYGCWLRFTEGVLTYNTIGDDKLSGCAEDWYTAAPRRPLAAFLYGWTLADQSVGMVRAADRKAKLKRALYVLHGALALNPDFAVLHIAEMRAYSFLGDRSETLQSARDAIEDARQNRLIIGMAASGMVLWNDLDGEIILNKLHKSDNPSQPWEHVALFVAAMMREDVAEAGKQINHLDDFETGQPFLLLLRAAHAKRSGRFREAETALAELNSDPRIRMAGPPELVNRLPVAPEVKARLNVWLSTSEVQAARN